MNDYHFYCEFEEISEILISFQEKFQVKFIPMGLFLESEIPKEEQSIFDIEGLGKMESGDVVQALRVLTLPRDAELFIRRVPQRKGGTRFAIDLLQNPVAITIHLGGYFGENILLPGRITTLKGSLFAKQALTFIGKEIRKAFKHRAGVYYISANARQAYFNGYRLTPNIRQPLDYDLKIE